MGYEFDSSVCHNKNAIDEEGNRKPPYKVHVPRKTQSLVSGFRYTRDRVCDAVYIKQRSMSEVYM